MKIFSRNPLSVVALVFWCCASVFSVSAYASCTTLVKNCSGQPVPTTVAINLDANGNPVGVTATGGRFSNGKIETCKNDKVTFSIPAAVKQEFAVLFSSSGFPGQSGRADKTWSKLKNNKQQLVVKARKSKSSSGTQECPKYAIHIPGKDTLDPVWILN